jgi:transcriptional regulator with XRE-family HTH domain
MTTPNLGLFPAPQATPFGVMLKLYREARGVSLRDLEKVTGLDHVTLSRIEQGRPCEALAWLRLQTWLLSPERLPVPPKPASALTEPACRLNRAGAVASRPIAGDAVSDVKPLVELIELPPTEPAASASLAAHP